MTAHTRVSAKGQVVIPKPLRDRLDWPAGTELEVEQCADGLLLRPAGDEGQRLSLEEFRRLRPRYDGPPVSLEEIDRAILREAAERHARKRRRGE